MGPFQVAGRASLLYFVIFLAGINTAHPVSFAFDLAHTFTELARTKLGDFFRGSRVAGFKDGPEKAILALAGFKMHHDIYAVG
jgi:hypothetical protein